MQTFLFAILACLLVGCAANAPIASTVPTTAPSVAVIPQQTYHLHLPGIGGEMFIHRWWCSEIHSAGPTTRSDVYDWTGRRWPIDVLQSVTRNRAEAKNVATQIAKMR